VLEPAHLILGGAFIGGLVSGLTGFGTGLVTLPIWLQAISPMLASPLVVICSLAAHVQTLPGIWHAIDSRRIAPFIAGGALGVPFGAWLLPHVSPGAAKLGLGVILVVLCGFLLLGTRRVHVRRGGRLADGLIGLGGGLLGGLAGLSGPLPTLWSGLRGWGKDEQRAVFQGFNVCVLVFAFVTQSVAGYMTAEVGWLVLNALPGTLVGAWIGMRLYGRLDAARFRRIVLALLLLAGIAMIVTAR
jgi:hypothetical protein